MTTAKLNENFGHDTRCPVDGKPPNKVCTCGADKRAREADLAERAQLPSKELIAGTAFEKLFRRGPQNVGEYAWVDGYAQALRDSPTPEPESAPHSADHLTRFTEWLVKEMPAGTVIGDPAWWARKLLAAACVFADEMPTPPPPDGLASISMEVRGNKVAVIHCFDALVQAQAWRDGLSPMKETSHG